MKLAQLKIDGKKNYWGSWCKFWKRDPLDLHPNDERALLEGCYFDLHDAIRIHKYYQEGLSLPDRFGGTKPFVLYQWWYREVFGPLFGWKRKDGRRRFNKAFVTTGKKSGKSSCASGLPPYMMIYDNEPEAECYATAVDRDQATIIYRKTERMVRRSPHLNPRLAITKSAKRIYDEETGSIFEAISSDADSTDGKNPHLIILDELHRWKDRDFYDSLIYGDIQRPQPLVLMITTAGSELEGIGYEEYCYAKDLLDPESDVYDMSRFAVICEPGYQTDEAGEAVKDQAGRPLRRAWNDEQAWLEANPVLLEDNTDVRLERLRANCAEAETSPAKRRNFTRYICNLWLPDVEETYILWDDWNACDEPLQKLQGRRCASALDLSSAVDITALCNAFRDDTDGSFDLTWQFWVPQELVADAEARDKVPYRDWIDGGWIVATPGRRVDYAYVRRSISGVELDEQGAALPVKWFGAAATQYNVAAIAYDPYNAEKLISELSDYDGIKTVEMRQGFLSMSKPCKRFRELVVDRKIRHGHNPVADWMIRNTRCDMDPAGNIKLNKKRSRKRIDGIVAAVMAVETADTEREVDTWSGKTGTGMWA